MLLATAAKLLVLAVSLGLDAFSVAVGIGIKGADVRTRWKVGLSFGAFQVLMPALGLGIGRVLGARLGDAAAYLGFVVLVVLGAYLAASPRREDTVGPDLTRGAGLLLASLSVSLDALAVGFTLGILGLPLALSLAVIGGTAFALTALGLEFGRRLGTRVERGAERWAGVVLALTGLFFLGQKLGWI